jgi:hypothetical protein
VPSVPEADLAVRARPVVEGRALRAPAHGRDMPIPRLQPACGPRRIGLPGSPVLRWRTSQPVAPHGQDSGLPARLWRTARLPARAGGAFAGSHAQGLPASRTRAVILRAVAGLAPKAMPFGAAALARRSACPAHPHGKQGGRPNSALPIGPHGP